ncbi:hypothetical protein GTC6_14814 [Gordonia terrae C-6]|uniref:Uncharacterized protein n=1 Tax=Gordonia terrae C-6 TaxID=1316928 RepID=R7Y786_9ACTN|nr:hypothetical protein [Gordonia terrae]EON31891.1 hypothetical protein GTC6_14814 [Gordonia terrae C-6]
MTRLCMQREPSVLIGALWWVTVAVSLGIAVFTAGEPTLQYTECEISGRNEPACTNSTLGEHGVGYALRAAVLVALGVCTALVRNLLTSAIFVAVYILLLFSAPYMLYFLPLGFFAVVALVVQVAVTMARSAGG